MCNILQQSFHSSATGRSVTNKIRLKSDSVVENELRYKIQSPLKPSAVKHLNSIAKVHRNDERHMDPLPSWATQGPLCPLPRLRRRRRTTPVRGRIICGRIICSPFFAIYCRLYMRNTFQRTSGDNRAVSSDGVLLINAQELFQRACPGPFAWERV